MAEIDRWDNIPKAYLFVGIFALSIAMVMGFMTIKLNSEISDLNKKNAELDRIITEYRPILTQINDLKKQQQLVNNKI